MKTARIQTAFKKASVVLAALILFTASAQAQNSGKYDSAYWKKFTNNLIAGFSHDCEGVRNSSIYFAGRYKIKGTTDALIDLLEKEENPKTRGLIVYSLFMIGEEKGLSKIYKLAADKKDEYFRKAFGEIINEFEPAKEIAAYSPKGQ